MLQFGETAMKYAQLFFSPTGGSKKVADAITGQWNQNVETVDLTDAAADFTKISFQRDDLVLIAVPSYGGRVPALAAERLAQVQGGGACCVLVCVYGNRAYEDTLVELQDIAEKCGFHALAAVSAIAEHSILRQYASNRPDQQDMERLHNISTKVLAKFSDGLAGKIEVSIPGNRPYKMLGSAQMVPKANKSCTGCGLCAADCPAQAISRTVLRSADPEKCISCMRCVERCPHRARRVNKMMVSAAALALKKECSVRKECELFL